MAACRPQPSSDRRPWFNYAHWLVGNLALAFAVVTIFLGGSLAALDIVPTGDYIGIVFAFCLLHFIAHLVLMVNKHFEFTDSIKRTTPEGEMEPAVGGFHSYMRWVVFAFYALAAFGIAIALAALIGKSTKGRECWGECSVPEAEGEAEGESE